MLNPRCSARRIRPRIGPKALEARPGTISRDDATLGCREMNKVFDERLGHSLMYTRQPGSILQDLLSPRGLDLPGCDNALFPGAADGAPRHFNRVYPGQARGGPALG